MDDRKQLRIWQWATILLLLCNGALIGLVWFAPPRGEGEGGRNNKPHDLLVREVGLNDVQVSQYDDLVKIHRSETQRLRREGKELRDQLFALLSKPGAKPDTLLARIGQNQQQIEQNTYQHFVLVRALCTEPQKEKFDHIINEVLRSMNRNKPPRPDGPRNDQQAPPPQNDDDNTRPDGPPPGDRRPPPPDRN